MSLVAVKQEENFNRKKLRVVSELQSALLGHVCSPDEGEDCFMSWLKANGEKFAAVLEKTLETDPHLVDRWDSDWTTITEHFVGELRMTN